VRRSGYLVLITVVLGLLCCAADSVCQQQPPERKALPTLMTAHDAHSLTSEQAARSYPVHLRTVVTYYDPYADPRHPAGQKYNDPQLIALLRTPSNKMTNGGMTAVELKRDDLEALAAYLRQLR
jgi:hypothetical protein